MSKEKVHFTSLDVRARGGLDTGFSNLSRTGLEWTGCWLQASQRVSEGEELEPGSADNHSKVASTALS